MHYLLIVLLLALIAVFVMQVLVKYELLSSNSRNIIGIILILVFFIIGFFTIKQDAREQDILELSKIFLSDKTIECNIDSTTIDVNSTNFNFVSGTLSVIGKNKEYYKINIPLANCQKKIDGTINQ